VRWRDTQSQVTQQNTLSARPRTGATRAAEPHRSELRASLGGAVGITVHDMTRYRFLDGMGDVVDEQDFADHATALAWVRDEADTDEPVERVEYLGAEGDWRWAGALEG
jgi:hypothetical protein